MSETVHSLSRGATVPDYLAKGEEQESQLSWLEKRNVAREQRINLKKLSHMRYQHPDLDEIHHFMLDFGVSVAKKTENEVWYKGYGPDHYVYYAQKGPKRFLGGVFEALTAEDFERATRLPQAGPVEELNDSPGSGLLVTITDPEGFPVNVIYGQDAVNERQIPQEKIVLNYSDEKLRIREFNRFKTGPAGVHKLGHYGFCTQKFDQLLQFYTTVFNFVPTDFVQAEIDGKKVPVTVFMHLDLGLENVDHHSLFLSANPKAAHVHHCSFEVHDFDTQQLGHQWLVRQGHKPAWGIGRHVLGSQIFDYWWDVSGNMVEHYADGDLVNGETPIGYVDAGPDSLAVWGPDVPSSFLQ